MHTEFTYIFRRIEWLQLDLDHRLVLVERRPAIRGVLNKVPRSLGIRRLNCRPF